MNPNYSRITHNSFQVRQDECDFRHRLTVSALVGYLQEAAWLASVESGYSIPELMEEFGVTWLLSRFVLKIDKYPIFGDEVHIQTYACKAEKFFTQRDFQVFVNGERVATAGSLWLLINVNEKKLMRATDFGIDQLLNTNETAFELPSAKIDNIQTSDYEYNTAVRWHDLDINQHTNNRHYFRWALDALPTEVLDNQTLSLLDFHFRTDSVLGDNLTIQLQKGKEEGQFLHKIIHADGKEAIRGRSEFVIC
jgi:medium-chain acyl-[acyl-carrier-protein] hydrolase